MSMTVSFEDYSQIVTFMEAKWLKETKSQAQKSHWVADGRTGRFEIQRTHHYNTIDAWYENKITKESINPHKCSRGIKF